MELGPGAAMVLQDVERRLPVRAVGDDLAIDHVIVGKRFQCARDRSKARGEVLARCARAAGPCRWPSRRSQIAVELQLVRPGGALRQLRNR